jgi:hypothetical protein
MAENKTKATKSSVNGYLATIKDRARREDCEALAKLMTKATKEQPVMWGTSIVGFGSYHYKYDSGREGDSCLAGFSSRAGDITIYVSSEFPKRDALFVKLGKHKAKGGCLYIKSMSDIDPKVLEQIVAAGTAARKKAHS